MLSANSPSSRLVSPGLLLATDERFNLKFVAIYIIGMYLRNNIYCLIYLSNPADSKIGPDIFSAYFELTCVIPTGSIKK